jgi:hypothetical protein
VLPDDSPDKATILRIALPRAADESHIYFVDTMLARQCRSFPGLAQAPAIEKFGGNNDVVPIRGCCGSRSRSLLGPHLAQETSWCKSKYGANDEIGAANLLSAQGVLEAAKLIKTGKTYALGVETNKTTPAYPPRTWNMIILQPGQVGGVSLGNTKTSYNDDIWNGWWVLVLKLMASVTSASTTSITTAT